MKPSKMTGNQSGVSAVEFAIVLPFLILLLFGIIEFSVLLYDKAMITNASREGARTGIVYSYPDKISDDQISAVVLNYCQGHLITFGEQSNVAVDISPDETVRAGSVAGDPLRVRVSYQYDFLVLPAFIADLAGGINLASESVMRME